MIQIREKLEPASLKIKSTQRVTFESSEMYYVLKTMTNVKVSLRASKLLCVKITSVGPKL